MNPSNKLRWMPERSKSWHGLPVVPVAYNKAFHLKFVRNQIEAINLYSIIIISPNQKSYHAVIRFLYCFSTTTFSKIQYFYNSRFGKCITPLKFIKAKGWTLRPKCKSGGREGLMMIWGTAGHKISFPGYIGEEDVPKDAYEVDEEHLKLDRDEPEVDGRGDRPKLPSLLAGHPDLLSSSIHPLAERAEVSVFNHLVDHKEPHQMRWSEYQLVEQHRPHHSLRIADVTKQGLLDPRQKLAVPGMQDWCEISEADNEEIHASLPVERLSPES